MRILLPLIFFLPTLGYARVFKISRGDHFSSPKLVRPFVGTSMKMTVIFDETAKYGFPLETASDQTDSNKLYGFADCKSSHMSNSARFGWYWQNDRLNITAFTHRHGSFYPEHLTSIDLNRPYEASIELSVDRKRYIYTFNGVTLESERGCDSARAVGYHLQPYFGGQQVAPHDVFVTVKLSETYGPAIVEKIFPNPVADGNINFKISSYENVEFSFIMYDIQGRLVYRSEKQKLSAGDAQRLSFDIGKSFASAMYFVVPVITLSDGTELSANIESQIADRALKLLIMNN